MSTVISQAIIYALKDSIKRQEEINQSLLDSDSKNKTKSLVYEQTKLLEQILSLTERVY